MRVVLVVAKTVPPTLSRTHDSGDERGFLDKTTVGGFPSIFNLLVLQKSNTKDLESLKDLFEGLV